jgi:hypothetical protein
MNRLNCDVLLSSAAVTIINVCSLLEHIHCYLACAMLKSEAYFDFTSSYLSCDRSLASPLLLGLPLHIEFESRIEGSSSAT